MAFNIPTQVSLSKYRPAIPVTPWTRAGDWPTITNATEEVQFLVSDLCRGRYSISTTFTQTGGVGNIYIDWGDSTTTTISTTTATTTNKTYTIGSGTPCSRGYTTFKIRIYGDAGTRITTVNFLPPFSGRANSTAYGVLEAYYGTTTITNMFNLWGFGGGDSGARLLEYVKLPETLPGIDMDSAFRGCIALEKVDMPTSASNINLRSTFSGCVALQTLEFPSNAILGDCFNGFNGCSALTSVTLPSSVTSITSLSGTFQNCRSLGNLIFPTGLDACTNFTNAFNNCNNLITVEIPGFYTALATNDVTLNATFQGCSSLQYVKLPTTYRSGLIFNLTSAFQSCSSLLSLNLSGMPDINNMTSAFNSTSSLSTVIFPASCPSLSSVTSAFTSSGIQEVNLPNTSVPITVNNTFTTCNTISSVTIPDTWTITTMANTFSGCNALHTVNLPANSQNSLGSMDSTFNNCVSLKNVTLPTSLTGVTTLSSTFNNCPNLTSVTFPSTLNLCTTMGSTFSGCSALSSVTLPTSMSACTAFSTTFQNCISLTSITMPATVNVTNSFLNLFSGCSALRTVTLPTTQTTGLTTISSMFNNCFSLTTINNTANLGNNSTGSTTYILGSGNDGMDSLTTLSFNTKFSSINISGTAAIPTALTSFRLLNNGSGQYAGISPQINVSNTSLGTAALDQLFTDLPTVTSRTINITGTPGAATCTRSIATAKGWSVTG
jgi:hypothetical protein